MEKRICPLINSECIKEKCQFYETKVIHTSDVYADNVVIVPKVTKELVNFWLE